MQQLMEPHSKVKDWMARVRQDTAPHYEAVSAVLGKAAKRFKEDRQKQAPTNSKM